jgi:tripartite-type tricarboxylate transporter receptor subunit TctC
MTSRRIALGAGLALPSLFLASRLSRADDFPSRAITVITPFGAGGLTDLSTRVIVERMSQNLGHPVVVENRAGGATSIASQAVMNARPDGYTLLMGASSLAINPALQPELAPQRPLDVFIPIGLAYRSAFVLQVHPSLPTRSLPEFIDYARARPGRVNFGSSGTGAVNHLCMEMLCRQAGLEVVHVPYRGGSQALVDLQAGRLHAMFSAVLEAQPPIAEGLTRGLAISSRMRAAVLPNVPSVADFVPGFEALFWQGLFAPTGTPPATIQRVAGALTAATDDVQVRSRLAERGVTVETGGANVLQSTLLADTAMWGKVIRDGNIKPD